MKDLNRRKKFSEFERNSYETQGFWKDPDPFVFGISTDSNHVRSGYIFFAINGNQKHGAHYATDAVERGAVLIITDLEGAEILKEQNKNLPLMIVRNPRQKLAEYAALWNELQPKIQIAITGTNGKTSVCNFTQQIWELIGYRSVSIGTLGVQGELEIALKNTTPDPIVLHEILRKLTQEKVDCVSMEASSHGLDQFRLDGVILKAAAFTNLSRDHLDYHMDEDKYLASKCMLFDRILPVGQIVVLNIDEPHAQVVKLVSENRGHKVVKVGAHESADLRICDQRFYTDGQEVKIAYRGHEQVIHVPLIGNFQMTNLLIAAALVISLGSPFKQVFNLLPKLKAVPGRMELVGTKKKTAKVFVDYAHTPDALLTVLKALRPHTVGKLILVFGAGGERDFGKRLLMGRVAEEYADDIFITDDNPRNEEPKKIRAEILNGCPSAREIPDRATAILTAIDQVEDGDVLLIAGKGHETGQIVGDDIFPFNDKEFVSMSLGALEGRKI